MKITIEVDGGVAPSFQPQAMPEKAEAREGGTPPEELLNLAGIATLSLIAGESASNGGTPPADQEWPRRLRTQMVFVTPRTVNAFIQDRVAYAGHPHPYLGGRLTGRSST